MISRKILKICKFVFPISICTFLGISIYASKNQTLFNNCLSNSTNNSKSLRVASSIASSYDHSLFATCASNKTITNQFDYGLRLGNVGTATTWSEFWSYPMQSYYNSDFTPYDEIVVDGNRSNLEYAFDQSIDGGGNFEETSNTRFIDFQATATSYRGWDRSEPGEFPIGDPIICPRYYSGSWQLNGRVTQADDTIKNITSVQIKDTRTSGASMITDIAPLSFSGLAWANSRTEQWLLDTNGDIAPAFNNLQNFSVDSTQSTNGVVKLKVIHDGAFYNAQRLQNVDFGKYNEILTFDEPGRSSEYQGANDGIKWDFGRSPSHNSDMWQYNFGYVPNIKVTDSTGTHPIGIFENDNSLTNISLYQNFYGVNSQTDPGYHIATLKNIPSRFLKGASKFSRFNTSISNTIAIPDSVESIGDNAFDGTSSSTSGMMSIIFPSNLQKLGTNIFGNVNKKFTSFTFPSNVPSNTILNYNWRSVFTDSNTQYYVHVPYDVAFDNDITLSPYYNALKIGNNVHISFTRANTLTINLANNVGAFNGGVGSEANNIAQPELIPIPTNSWVPRVINGSDNKFNFTVTNGNYLSLNNFIHRQNYDNSVVSALNYKITGTSDVSTSENFTLQAKINYSTNDQEGYGTNGISITGTKNSIIEFWSVKNCNFTMPSVTNLDINRSTGGNVGSITATPVYDNYSPKTGVAFSYTNLKLNGTAVSSVNNWIKFDNVSTDANGTTSANLNIIQDSSNPPQCGCYTFNVLASYNSNPNTKFTCSTTITINLWNISSINISHSETEKNEYSVDGNFNFTTKTFANPSTTIVFTDNFKPSGVSTDVNFSISNVVYDGSSLPSSLSITVNQTTGVVSESASNANLGIGVHTASFVLSAISVAQSNVQAFVNMKIIYQTVTNITWTQTPSISYCNLEATNVKIPSTTYQWTADTIPSGGTITYSISNLSSLPSYVQNLFNHGFVDFDTSNGTFSVLQTGDWTTLPYWSNNCLSQISLTICASSSTYQITTPFSLSLYSLDRNGTIINNNGKIDFPNTKSGTAASASNSYSLSPKWNGQGYPSSFSSTSWTISSSPYSPAISINQDGLISWTALTAGTYTLTSTISVTIESGDSPITFTTSPQQLPIWEISSYAITTNIPTNSKINASSGTHTLGTISTLIQGTNVPNDNITYTWTCSIPSIHDSLSIDGNGIVSIDTSRVSINTFTFTITSTFNLDSSYSDSYTFSITSIQLPTINFYLPSDQLDNKMINYGSSIPSIYVNGLDSTDINLVFHSDNDSSNDGGIKYYIKSSTIPTGVTLSQTSSDITNNNASLTLTPLSLSRQSTITIGAYYNDIGETDTDGTFTLNIFCYRLNWSMSSITMPILDYNFSTGDNTGYSANPNFIFTFDPNFYSFGDSNSFLNFTWYNFSLTFNVKKDGVETNNLIISLIPTNDSKHPGALSWKWNTHTNNKSLTGIYEVTTSYIYNDGHGVAKVVDFKIKINVKRSSSPVMTILIVVIIIALIIILIVAYRIIRNKMTTNKMLKQDERDERELKASKGSSYVPPSDSGTSSTGF